MAGMKLSELERIDASIKVQLDLLRHSSNVEASVLRLIEQMKSELIAKIASGDLTTWGKARINQMLREADATIADYYARAQALVVPTHASVAAISSAQTAAGIAAPSLPSKTVIKSLVANVIIEGASTSAWWAKLAGDTSFKFAAAVRQGIAQGETQRQIFQRVNDAVDMSGRNSAALVHTSTMQVLNDANMEVLKANADVAPVMRFSATLDSHTCLQCFPAGTMVLSAGEIKNIFRAKYRGNVFVITTASGKKLTGTPNHPILTARGFLPMCELNEGDQVINSTFNNGVVTIGNKNVSVPSDIAEIFDSFHKPSIFNVVRKCASAIDFYGDGVGMYSEIDIASTKRHLRFTDKSFVSESITDKLFSFIESSAQLPCSGELFDLLIREWSSGLSPESASILVQRIINTSLGTPDNFSDIVWLLPFIKELHDPRSVPFDTWIRLASLKIRHDSVTFEQGCDSGACSVEHPRYLASGCSFSIHADNIVNIVCKFDDFHVYTLESSLGLYTAEGIIVKNCAPRDGLEWETETEKPIGHNIPFEAPPLHFACRCTINPITILDKTMEGQRASTFGAVDRKVTFTDFLKRQTPEFQDDVLGKGRADLYRAGKITLRDVVSGRGKPLTLNELEKKYK